MQQNVVFLLLSITGIKARLYNKSRYNGKYGGFRHLVIIIDLNIAITH
jgi:hypothetical protein